MVKNEPYIYIADKSNDNLIKNITGSNDSLKCDIKYSYIRPELSELYLVQKYHFFSIENEKITVTKAVITHKLLHKTAIWLMM